MSASSNYNAVPNSNTIFCPNCGAENPNSSNFCKQCGKDLKGVQNKCPRCSEPFSRNDSFCQKCGQDLSTVRGNKKKSGSNKNAAIAILAIIAVILLIVVVVFVVKPFGNSTSQTTSQSNSQTAQTSQTSSTETQSKTETINFHVVAKSGTSLSSEIRLTNGYIIPDSNKKAYTADEILKLGLNEAELDMAINEIYARIGMTFKNDALQLYFDQRDWYERSDTNANPEKDSIADQNVKALLSVINDKYPNSEWRHLSQQDE